MEKKKKGKNKLRAALKICEKSIKMGISTTRSWGRALAAQNKCTST